ncbi:hypothetical protein [Sneathiella glossodoripedis]|uniref:hypothetical protein n=1 Tax=Sneathiella glossodoripedis TaxID=418853 RepID=UPI0004708E8F|nr:hypothetical protein [Sneathiella glossodoripedis]
MGSNGAMAVYRFIILGIMVTLLSGCVTPQTFFGRAAYSPVKQTVYPPSVSPALKAEDLADCNSSQCLLSLAKTQNLQTNKFEKMIAKTGFATTHVLMGEDDAAISLVDSIDNESVRNIFYSNFGAIDKDRIVKFLVDTQRWENVDLPLPASLLGRNEDYDTLYAFFLALGGDMEGSARLAKTLKKPDNRNRVNYLLALRSLEKKNFDSALHYARQIEGRMTSATKPSRQRLYIFIYQSMYLSGDKERALDAAENTVFLSDKDAIRAGISIALVKLDSLDAALKMIQGLYNPMMREIAYSNILNLFARKGELDQIQLVLRHMPAASRNKLKYAGIVAKLASNGHLPQAEDFLQDIPNDVETIYALSEMGKYTGDSSYFQQSLLLAKELQDRQDSDLMRGTISLAGNMAQAGFFEESVKTLHLYKKPIYRKISRELIFKSLFKSPDTPKDYKTLLDFAEQNLNASKPDEYNQILKNTTKLMLVNHADLAGINRYLKLVDRIENRFNRENLYGRILPHLAYLGEQQKANQIIMDMTHTMPRINALLRLAEFHILKKKLNTI